MMHTNPNKSSPVAIAFTVITVLVVLYFIPLIAVVLDEGVFRTNYISQTLPDWCEDLFNIVYAPIIGFFK